MKSYLLPFLLLGLFAAGCGNNDTPCEDDLPSIEEYIADNNLTTQETPEGVRYIIEEPGGSGRPGPNDTVVVQYSGTLTDDREFDSSNMQNSPPFPLQNLIAGWQIGIPLIGEGGRIRLFIPSELAYGPRAVGIICPNSDLIFDVTLVSF